MPHEVKHPAIDSSRSTAQMREMLSGVIDYARNNIAKVDDARAKALFETTAEVLLGLRKAFQDFERKSDPGWQKAS
jgi:hypothetical protein